MQTSTIMIDFLASKAAAGRSKKTMTRLRSILTHYAAARPELPLTPEPVESYISAIPGEPETRDTYYRTLSSFYGWLVRRKKIGRSRNPMPEVERPILRPKVPVILTQEELAGLLNDALHPEREGSLVYFLVDTACRIGEAGSLRHSRIRDGYAIIAGKTGERMVPMSAETIARIRALPRHPQDTDAVWWGRKGALRTDSLGALVRQSFRRAGLQGPRYSAHALRHSFATMWDGDETYLQQILGHASLAMVKRYRQYRIARARAQHAVHSPLAQIRRAAGSQMAFRAAH